MAFTLRSKQDCNLISQCVSYLFFLRQSWYDIAEFLMFLFLIVFYLHRLNLLVFIMKLVLYLYARFLLSVLYTVLVIPRDL